MKQLELFELGEIAISYTYEIDLSKSYERFMWQKNGVQTIYWPTQQDWDKLCEDTSHDSSKKKLEKVL